MKKNLLLFLLFLAVKSFAQDVAQPFTYPMIDSVVMYQKVQEVPGKDQTEIYKKALNWYAEKFSYKSGKIISSEPSIGQLKFALVADVDYRTVNYILQVDCKDNKYRYQIYDIKSTVKGKENAVSYRQYLVDIKAEFDNKIVLSQLKGYTKGQKKTVEKQIMATDFQFNEVIKSLIAAIGSTPKQENF